MRKALLVLAICSLAAPAFAGGGYSLFGSYGAVDNHEWALGAGMRLTVGGEHWVGDLTWTCCHTYNVESFSLGKHLEEKSQVPKLQIETDYSESDGEQIRTRIEAFLEML